MNMSQPSGNESSLTANEFDVHQSEVSVVRNETDMMFAMVPNATCQTWVTEDADDWVVQLAPVGLQVLILASWWMMLSPPLSVRLAALFSGTTVCLQIDGLIQALTHLSAPGRAFLLTWMVTPFVALCGIFADQFHLGNYDKFTRLSCAIHSMAWVFAFMPIMSGLWGGNQAAVYGALYLPLPTSLYDFSPGSRAPLGFAIAESCRCLSAALCAQPTSRSRYRDAHVCTWIILPLLLFVLGSILSIVDRDCFSGDLTSCYPRKPWWLFCDDPAASQCEVDIGSFAAAAVLLTLLGSIHNVAQSIKRSHWVSQAVVRTAYAGALVFLPHYLITRTLTGNLDGVLDVRKNFGLCVPLQSISTTCFLATAQSLTVGLTVFLFVPSRPHATTGIITTDGFGMRP